MFLIAVPSHYLSWHLGMHECVPILCALLISERTRRLSKSLLSKRIQSFLQVIKNTLRIPSKMSFVNIQIPYHFDSQRSLLPFSLSFVLYSSVFFSCIESLICVVHGLDCQGWEIFSLPQPSRIIPRYSSLCSLWECKFRFFSKKSKAHCWQSWQHSFEVFYPENRAFYSRSL